MNLEHRKQLSNSGLHLAWAVHTSLSEQHTQQSINCPCIRLHPHSPLNSGINLSSPEGQPNLVDFYSNKFSVYPDQRAGGLIFPELVWGAWSVRENHILKCNFRRTLLFALLCKNQMHYGKKCAQQTKDQIISYNLSINTDITRKKRLSSSLSLHLSCLQRPVPPFPTPLPQ